MEKTGNEQLLGWTASSICYSGINTLGCELAHGLLPHPFLPSTSRVGCVSPSRLVLWTKKKALGLWESWAQQHGPGLLFSLGFKPDSPWNLPFLAPLFPGCMPLNRSCPWSVKSQWCFCLLARLWEIYVMMNGRCSAQLTWMLHLQINQRMIINTYRIPSRSTAPFKVFLQPLSQFICKINSGGSLLYYMFYSWRNGVQMRSNHLRLSGIPTKVNSGEFQTQLPGPITILRWHRDFHIINLSSSLCSGLEEEMGRPELS